MAAKQQKNTACRRQEGLFLLISCAHSSSSFVFYLVVAVVVFVDSRCQVFLYSNGDDERRERERGELKENLEEQLFIDVA